MKTYELIITTKIKGEEIETDKVIYDSNCNIQLWFVWSDHCNDWVPAPLFWLENTWPSKFDKMQILINEENERRIEQDLWEACQRNVYNWINERKAYE